MVHDGMEDPWDAEPRLRLPSSLLVKTIIFSELEPPRVLSVPSPIRPPRVMLSGELGGWSRVTAFASGRLMLRMRKTSDDGRNSPRSEAQKLFVKRSAIRARTPTAAAPRTAESEVSRAPPRRTRAISSPTPARRSRSSRSRPAGRHKPLRQLGGAEGFGYPYEQFAEPGAAPDRRDM
jgi:hypothetical protein